MENAVQKFQTPNFDSQGKNYNDCDITAVILKVAHKEIQICRSKKTLPQEEKVTGNLGQKVGRTQHSEIVQWEDMNQFFPLSLLSVKIIKANIVTSSDRFSASDCYVTLHLPTASLEKFRTQIVRNSYNPVWNEIFYFKIQTQIKNVLELKVCDADPVSKDDVQFTVLFDLSKVQPGSRALEIFSLKQEKQECPYIYESLEVEFSLTDTPGPPEQLMSNDVLVARELFILDVKVSKQENEKLLQANKILVISVQESYERTQKTTKKLYSFCFHCIKSWEPVLKAKIQKVLCEADSDSDYSLILPLKMLPVGCQVSIPVKEGNSLELYLQITDWPQSLDVRLGYELCPDEQDFLCKRKRIVASALCKLFNLQQELLEDEVPVIAVMATGGGIRAMSGLYGHLLALQKLNLLDCIMYITSASGSTWTLSDLYQNMDWSHQNLEEFIKQIKKEIAKSKMDVISTEHLKHYHKELIERVKIGHFSSFTSLWALVQEALFNGKISQGKLSEQRQALIRGQSPFPIYTAINVKVEAVSTFDFREWVEFNPYEVGFLKYGAHIRTEDFDSEFFMGRLVKRLPESRMCFLEGIWTNIFSPNLLDCLYWSSSPEEFWKRWVKDMAEKSEENNSDDASVRVYKPPGCTYGKLCEIFNDILTDRPLRGKNHNFLQAFDFDKDYLNQKEFMEWSDTIFDVSSNKLTPSMKSLCLMDIGYFVNNSSPPLLKPERNVDIIIALDYNLTGLLEQVEQMALYCEVQGIPFPKIQLSEEDQKNPKECYVFSDEDNPKAPILVCFPLVNCTFKEYSAPGVKRTPSDMSGGEVNLDKNSSPYKTIHVTYSGEDFDKLLNLCTYNILYSQDFIFQAIECAIQKRQSNWS